MKTNRNWKLNDLVGSRPYSAIQKRLQETSVEEERGYLRQDTMRLSVPAEANPVATMIIIGGNKERGQ